MTTALASRILSARLVPSHGAPKETAERHAAERRHEQVSWLALVLSAALHAPILVAANAHEVAPSSAASFVTYDVELEPVPPTNVADTPVPSPQIENGPVPPAEPAIAPPAAPAAGPVRPPESTVSGPVGAARQAAPGEVPHPAAAMAGRVLTAEAVGGSPSPLDFTIVQGTGARYAGGVTSTAGTSKTAVRDITARGAGAAAPISPVVESPAPAKRIAAPADRSSPARPRASVWDCGFPPAADAVGVHRAIVRLVVVVGTDGHARSVTRLSDPGNGFGEHAERCALGKTYVPARGRDGRPIAASTAPITVRFSR